MKLVNGRTITMVTDAAGIIDIKSKLRAILTTCADITIAGHINPDGDCIGACQGLGLALKTAGKNVRILLDDYGSKYECIPGGELLFRGDARGIEPEVFIACDCADKTRLGSSHDVFERASTKICIDHHATNTGFGDINIIDAKASSTCELLFNVISGILPLTPEAETAFCAGIIYDTGGLRHISTTPATLNMVSSMLSREIPFTQTINALIYEHSIKEAKALAVVIGHMYLTEGYPIAVSYISMDDLDEIGASFKDLDGIVEYIIGTKEADLAVFAYEKAKGDVKVSMRSKDIDVGVIAKELGGGGHRLAAGFNRAGEINDVIDTTLELLKRAYK